MLRKLPIATQIMLLVILATLLASGAMVAITLGGPPPRQAPSRLEELAPALASDRVLRGVQRAEVTILPSPPEGLERNTALERALARVLARPGSDLRAYAEQSEALHENELRGRYMIAFRSNAGGWTVFERGPDTEFARWQRVTAGAIAAVLAAILFLAWLLARQIVRPIEVLAKDARMSPAGKPWIMELPAGPPEIRAAARSLHDLHARNLEHAGERLAMLAAISHDVGTPLARLAFRMDKLPEETREAAMAEIVSIRRLLSDSLTLARGWSGAFEPVPLKPLCENIVRREAGLGNKACLDRAEDLTVRGDSLSLERLIQNLVDNALRYGKVARLSLVKEGDHARISIEDDGPGFPRLPVSELLKPFVRGDASRNSGSGGSGLGLSIASQIANQHEGTLELGSSRTGGASVVVRLPLSPVD